MKAKIPNIDLVAVRYAAKVVEDAESKIRNFAEEIGLPVRSVYVGRDGYACVSCSERVFVGSNDRRNLTEKTFRLDGGEIWNALREAASAYKSKRAA